FSSGRRAVISRVQISECRVQSSSHIRGLHYYLQEFVGARRENRAFPRIFPEHLQLQLSQPRLGQIREHWLRESFGRRIVVLIRALSGPSSLLDKQRRRMDIDSPHTPLG